MSKKKKNIALINELTANNRWEQVHRERDRLKAERIKNLGERSRVDVFIGVILAFPAYNSILDLVEIMKANVKETGVENILKGVGAHEFIWAALLAAAGLVFFFLAMSKNETIDRLTAARYRWIPNRTETDYIEKRFDNDFIRSILSEISSADTHSIQAGLDAVTINNNTGPSVFNYNRFGFSRLTNYDTKQLAFYLASHSFPDGFLIYQTRITPTGSERFIGGITDVGRDRPPEEDEDKHSKKMFARLFEQLRQFVSIKNPFKVYLKEPDTADVDNGQIVINKGFMADNEGYAEL